MISFILSLVHPWKYIHEIFNMQSLKSEIKFPHGIINKQLLQ